MKRMRRDPIHFDAFDLFGKFALQHSVSLRDADAPARFASTVQQAVDQMVKRDTVVHGHRAQAMFEMVVGSLGKVLLLRQEDQGEIFYATDQELTAPDFRIVLMDRSHLLVEVKNHHQDDADEPHVERWDYLERLRAYADLMECEIFIATYWVRYNLWTLVSPSTFERNGTKAALTLGRAMAANEMSRIGDLVIGTRWPLRIRLTVDEQERVDSSEGESRQVLIRDVVMFSEDRLLRSEAEQRIAMTLILNGDWEETTETEIDAEGAVTALSFTFAPGVEARRQDDQGFDIVGTLSGLLSRLFQGGTADEDGVKGIRFPFEPGNFGDLIPADYKSEFLPLWRVHQKPVAADDAT